VKTEASGTKIPLDDALIEKLLDWRKERNYSADIDFVFASWKMQGKQPFWISREIQHFVKPIAAELGIQLKGFHTLRHCYTTLLRQSGNDVNVVQDLLRHASYKLTMDVYDDAVSSEKREAHSGVILLISNRTQAEDGRMASLDSSVVPVV
jgi:integrase